MENSRILQEIASLPLEAQKQVMDFVAFLRTRYEPVPSAPETDRVKLAEEPFVGMWRDRKDMRDSSEWVRQLRRRESATDWQFPMP
jgi:hypothetical protein